MAKAPKKKFRLRSLSERGVFMGFGIVLLLALLMLLGAMLLG